MTEKRGYGESCPVAHSLDLIGDRWALIVIRELRLGPRRFSELQTSLPNAGPTVLSQRLRDLEAAGVLRRRSLPPPAPAKVYELTEWGAGLEPVFRALAKWGMASPVPRQGPVTNDTVMLGLRTFWQAPAREFSASYQISLGPDTYRLSIVDGQLTGLARGEAIPAPDATIATDRDTFGRIVSRDLTLAAAVKQGLVTLCGDSAASRQLFAALARSAATPAAAQA
jgi:DNA-binding HxlR family transcriptional regulator